MMNSKVGITLDVETGGFISGMASAERTVKSFDQAIKQAEKDGSSQEDILRLTYQRDTLKTNLSDFTKNTNKLFSTPSLMTTTANGMPALKMDSESNQRFKDLTENIKKLNANFVEQMEKGNTEEAWKTFSQLQQEQGKYKKAVDEATAPTGMQAIQNSTKAIVFGQIANSFNEGLRTWANSLDRSSIVNAFGSGDILGGRIAEKQRTADIVGGGTQAVLGLAGSIASVIPGGQLVGIGLSAAGAGINTLAHGLINPEKTEAAYAGLWQQRSADAMNLAALTGDPKLIREAFKDAADAAAAFGYSAEEGMDVIKQAVQQGLGKDQAVSTAEQVFQYERTTGADRGTLSSLANMSARYGMGDALNAGWGGLGASGMSVGQYSEFLRAMQRSLEDGISKGFSKSADQVAQEMTMLANMTGNDPLWQGENGARRLQGMNAGLEATTGLQSASDIIAFRAAQNILGDKYTDYTDAMMVMEKGLTPELFKEYMKLTEGAEGSGNRTGIVERMRQTFGLNYISARKLYDNRDYLATLKDDELKVKLEEYKAVPLPDASSPELEAAKTTQEIINLWAKTGQAYWDKKMPGTLSEELAKAFQEFKKATGSYVSTDTTGMKPHEEFEARQADYRRAMEYGTNEEFEKAARELEIARMKALEPQRSIFDEVGNIQNRSTMVVDSFFRKGDKGEDAASKRKMFYMFDDALRTGEKEQIQAAADTLKRLQAVPPEVRERWDSSNTINPLADSNGIQSLLTALNRLIEIEEKNGTMRIIYE